MTTRQVRSAQQSSENPFSPLAFCQFADLTSLYKTPGLPLTASSLSRPPLTAYLNLSCRMFPNSKPVPSLPGLLPSHALSQFLLTSPSPTSDTPPIPFPNSCCSPIAQPKSAVLPLITALLTAPAPFHRHPVPSFLPSCLFSTILIIHLSGWPLPQFYFKASSPHFSSPVQCWPTPNSPHLGLQHSSSASWSKLPITQTRRGQKRGTVRFHSGSPASS